MAIAGFTFKFIQQERLPGAPARVQPHGDGHGQARLRQHVGERGAVQLVPEHVLVVFVCVQLSGTEYLSQYSFVVAHVYVVRRFVHFVRLVQQLTVLRISEQNFNYLLRKTSEYQFNITNKILPVSVTQFNCNERSVYH